MRNSMFLFYEAQRNFRKELLNSVEAQRNSAFAEQNFFTKSKRNLISPNKIKKHYANFAF